MLGGRVRWEALSVVGQLGDGLFSRINVQKAFLGAAGFTLESGLADATDEEAQIKRSMVAAAREVIAIVDHTKWERAAFATFCPTDQIGVVLTDDARSGRRWSRPSRSRRRGPARSAPIGDARRRDDGHARRGRTGDDGRLADGRDAAPRRASRDLQAVRGDPGARRRLARPAARRGPRPRRRERRRQEHARQDPGRRPPARQRARSGSTARRRTIHGPAHARALGIAVVHQEPRLFPDLTVAENVFIGHAPSGPARHDRLGRDAARGPGAVRRARRAVRRRRAGPRPVDGRPAAHRDRQGAVGRGPGADPRRADRLAVRPRGRAPVHDRPPAPRSRRRRSCSSATASTRSSTCATGRRSSATASTSITTPTSELTTADLVRHMVGRAVSLFPKVETPIGDVLLEVEGLTRAGAFRDVALLRPGRRDRRASPGWSGPAGPRSPGSCSGSTSATPARSGSAARPVDFASPSAAMNAGHRLPARGPPPGGPRPRLLDRPERDAADPAAPVPALARPRARRSARSPTSYTEQFNVRMTGVDQLVGALSGGNQQKVVLAKWLASKPRILILDEPTRGIDIGAKVEVHRIISELAASGLGDHPHLERPARGPRDVRPDPRPPRGPGHRRDPARRRRPRSG